MKETIYTIPINEAFDTDCECPVCEFVKNEENSRVEYSLGASMMEPDERIRSNENGYCQRHTQMMYNSGNKLSHALVLETRLQYIEATLKEFSGMVCKISKPRMFAGKKTSDILNTPEYRKLKDTSESCVICQRLETVTDRFLINLFHMYKKDEEFRQKFFSCKGFCIKHFNLLVSYGASELSYEQYKEFLSTLCKIQTENICRVSDDVNWFTKKFDYRYRDEDWKNSKDAVPRGCTKISGFIEE